MFNLFLVNVLKSIHFENAELVSFEMFPPQPCPLQTIASALLQLYLS